MDPSLSLAREYSAKAVAYERTWAPVIGPMAEPLFEALPAGPARLLLDVGAGTGRHLAALAAVAPDARILGTDRAEGMLRAAPRHTRYDLAAMDAQRLALRDAAVDVATLIFMLFHVPDPPAALCEVRRVLRPGGTIGLVTWGHDDGVPGLPIWKEELDAHGAAPDPRDRSVMRQEEMDTPPKVEGLLSEAGYVGPRIWLRTFEHQWSVPALMELQLTCGMASRRVSSLGPDAASLCRSRVHTRLSALSDADLVHRAEVLYAVAQAPSAAGD